MSKIRTSESASEAFRKAFGLEDVKEALSLITTLVGKSITEMYVATKFNELTGEAVKHEWMPDKNLWDGRLWLDYFWNGPGIGKETMLYKTLMNKLKPGLITIIEGDGKKFVVKHVPERSEGGSGSMSDQGGTTPAHLLFEEAI